MKDIRTRSHQSIRSQYVDVYFAIDWKILFNGQSDVVHSDCGEQINNEFTCRLNILNFHTIEFNCAKLQFKYFKAMERILATTI